MEGVQHLCICGQQKQDLRHDSADSSEQPSELARRLAQAVKARQIAEVQVHQLAFELQRQRQRSPLPITTAAADDDLVHVLSARDLCGEWHAKGLDSEAGEAVEEERFRLFSTEDGTLAGGPSALPAERDSADFTDFSIDQVELRHSADDSASVRISFVQRYHTGCDAAKDGEEGTGIGVATHWDASIKRVPGAGITMAGVWSLPTSNYPADAEPAGRFTATLTQDLQGGPDGVNGIDLTGQHHLLDKVLVRVADLESKLQRAADFADNQHSKEHELFALLSKKDSELSLLRDKLQVATMRGNNDALHNNNTSGQARAPEWSPNRSSPPARGRTMNAHV